MSFVAKQKASLGRAVITKQITDCSSAVGFTYQQAQVVSFAPALITGQTMSINLAIFPLNYQAVQAYGYEDLPKGYVRFNQLFSVNPETTAQLLGDQIEATYPKLTANVTSGQLVISTGSNYGLTFNYNGLRFLTATPISVAVDLATYNGPAILQATPTGDAIRYSEDPVSGVSPTASVGLYVAENSPFDIVGTDNIIAVKLIEVASSAVVDYTIYI